MSGPTAPRASVAAGGFLAQTPLARDQVESIIGPICDDGWEKFGKAYEEFGWGMISLNASRANRKKDDPQGWYALQTAVSRDLGAAASLIERQWDAGDKPGSGARLRFMREADSNYRLQHLGDEGDSAPDAIMAAHRALRRALTIVRAEPMSLKVASEAELRRCLARTLAEACGVDRASDGRTLGQIPEGAAESDLTAFERLISELGVHVAETPEALSRWVRQVIGRSTR